MPSMSAHMAIATRLSEKLNVDKKDFIKGNLLPDLYDDKVKSHYKIQGKKYSVPDINKAIKSLDLSSSLYLGYLSHLLLDKYYFDDYLLKYDSDLFKDKTIYSDYDIINKDIIDYFNLDVNYIKGLMKDFPKEINQKKIDKNLECLDYNIDKKTNILDKNNFLKFLDEISNKIYYDIITLGR